MRHCILFASVVCALVSFAFNGALVRGADDFDSDRVVMISAHDPDLIAFLDNDGKILWSIDKSNGVSHPQDAVVLEDGTLFFSVIFGAKSLNIADKKILWSYDAPEGTQNPVAQPLDDGFFLVGNEGPCRLLEIDAKGETRREVKVDDCPFKGSHGQFRFCRKTPEGTYLFPMYNAGVLREYNAQGDKLREFPLKGASVCAIRLENGNTVCSSGSGVEELDKNDKVVWSFDCVADGGLKPGAVTAVSRLKNGNTLIGYYHNDPATPDVVEISPDKKIVWSVTLKDVAHIAAVQALTKEFKPSPEILAR